MSGTTILLTTLAALLALGFVFFKYFVGNKKRDGRTFALAFLRFCSVFILLILLINPEIKQTEYTTEKPQLLLAQDLSGSINYLEKADSAVAFLKALRNDPRLQEKFDIKTFGFGRDLKVVDPDSLIFSEGQTNISSAIRGLSKINNSSKSALVLITDGNQTLGEDYQYQKLPEGVEVFPVAVGDTTTQRDLSISSLNVNKYAFLNNRFPVEIFVNYSGSDPVRSNFTIRSGSNVLFSETLNFDEETTSRVITPTLPADQLGVKIYEAAISPLDQEKNTVNNSQRFGVEVIDERTEVLILSAVLHPDLGMFKKSIEANQQRKAEIVMLQDFDKTVINDFQLFILYQPNNRFKEVISNLNDNNLNFLLVTGTQTDWNFVNSVIPLQKDYTAQAQDYLPVYNPNFSQFQFTDIGFAGFPPLVDKFGTLEISREKFNSLLFQKLEGIETNDPLLATYEEGTSRRAILLGENIWKWRTQTYVEENSFAVFDDFFGKLVQYLSSTQKRDRLSVDVGTFFAENEEVTLSAQYFDQNFQFDPSGDIEVTLQNVETEEQLQAQLLLNNNRYTFSTNNLEAGEYNYTVTETTSGISRNGSFNVLEYNVEQQFSSANITKLQNFAASTGSAVYFLDSPEVLVSNLLEDNQYVALQKSHEKEVPLINWKALLLLLILSLSAEWFTRKYFGLI